MECTKGVLIINEYNSGYVNINGKRIYITKNNLSNAFHGENVEIEYYEEEGIYHGKVINYSLVNKIFFGLVHHKFNNETYIYIPELTNKNLILVKNFYLKEKKWVKVIVKSESNNILTGDILEVLDEDIEENLDNIIEKKFNLYSKEYILYKFIDQPNIYKDQTKFDTFTINERNSSNYENAFSIELINNKAYIYFHISDVSYYINPKFKDFDKIIKKGCTYYGINKRWNMISENYSNNLFSITPHKKSYVLTNSFIYNIDTETLEYNGLFYSIIESKNNYDYIENDLNTQKFDLLYKSSLLIKNEINDIIISKKSSKNQNISETILYYWRINVNKIMSSKINNIIYVNNPIPKSHKFNNIKNYAKSKNINLNTNNRYEIINFMNKNENNLLKYIIKLLLEKSYYSIDKDSYHYQLNMSSYSEWTSPTNKASDLLNHCILKGFTINISDYIKYINDLEFKKEIIEKFILVNNYKNINKYQIFNSTIIELNNNKISIYIEELDSKYTIDILQLSCQRLFYNQSTNSLKNNLTEYKLFDNLKVVVKNIFLNNIEFDIYHIPPFFKCENVQ